jgi:hypothetical protein
MVRAMTLEATLTAFSKKYAVGISYDLLRECKQALEVQRKKGDVFSIILGKKDKLFPPAEIASAFESYGIKGLDIVTVPNDTHSSLAVRASVPVLDTALKKVRQTTNNR